jgi:acetylornithine deacetylase
MRLFALTRQLIDIESITPNEKAIGAFLAERLGELAARTGGELRVDEVEPDRHNVSAIWGQPLVTLSTHMDTVPPFIPSREDDEFIHGRGACDVKGIIAAMITAAEEMLAEGRSNFALVFVVGEERNSAGAYYAAAHPIGSRFLINGEPTENKLSLGTKGALRFELIAHGRMAHSAYPELGDSAMNKLLDALELVRRIPLPTDVKLGPSTLNIGVIEGGRAPNVIPDYARAQLFIRLVDDGAATRKAVNDAVAHLVEVKEILCIPAIHLGSLPGFDTMVASYTTDIPAFGGAWGTPFLLGPGTIHFAHTSEERVPKKELLACVEIYKRMVKELQEQCQAE